TPTTHTSPLSLHDALPISCPPRLPHVGACLLARSGAGCRVLHAIRIREQLDLRDGEHRAGSRNCIGATLPVVGLQAEAVQVLEPPALQEQVHLALVDEHRERPGMRWVRGIVQGQPVQYAAIVDVRREAVRRRDRVSPCQRCLCKDEVQLPLRQRGQRLVVLRRRRTDELDDRAPDFGIDPARDGVAERVLRRSIDELVPEAHFLTPVDPGSDVIVDRRGAVVETEPPVWALHHRIGEPDRGPGIRHCRRVVYQGTAPVRYVRARRMEQRPNGLRVLGAGTHCREGELQARGARRLCAPLAGGRVRVRDLVDRSHSGSPVPRHVNSSVTVAYSVRMAPQPYANAAWAPLAIANPAAGLLRLSASTSFGFLTSNRLLHAAPAATSPAPPSATAARRAQPRASEAR